MSVWTHVAAIFRVDSIRGLFPPPKFDEVFGKECLFESGAEVWNDVDKHPENYLPMGSEGSLQKSVWVNPESCHLAAYTVSVFGDLRDYDDVQAIVEWFKDKCAKVRIRQACITVECENGNSALVKYEEKEAFE